MVESSGSTLHDAAAVQAIKTASPFPEVPAEMMATMPKGSTDVPIVARFKYVVETTPVR
jgi:TonB family protein